MPQLCTSTPIPSFNDLYNQFAPNLKNPPFNFTMPQLPTLPVPMFPTMKCPNIEMVTSIAELKATQLMQTCTGMLTPLTSFLSVDPLSLLPAVPVLNIKLPDILNGNPSDLLASVKAKIAAGIQFPGIPSPLFPDMRIPEFESLSTMCNLIKSYIMSLPDMIFGLINQVCGKLKFASMPAMPTMPTLDQLKSMALAALPPLPNLPNPQTYLDMMKSGLPTNLMFNFSIPGFPAIPSLPDPLFPSIHYPEFEFYTGFGNMVDHLTSVNMQSCVDFCQNTLGSKLSFTFPTMCIPFNPAT
jgi:hypothetical protein